MSASQSGVYNLQAFTDLGAPLVGGRLYTYAYGTTTQKTAYTDHAAAVPHTYTSDGLGGQYIALNSRGELPAPLYLSGGSYDLALKTSAGATVWTRRADPVWDIVNDLSGNTGSSLVGFKQSATGAVDRTVQDKLRETVSVKDFGAKGDGTTDDTAAIQLAINAGNSVFFPPGTYKYSTLAVSNAVKLIGSGVGISILQASVTNTTNISVTTSNIFEVSDMTFNTSVTALAGSVISVSPSVSPNAFSVFKRLAFNNAYTAISLTAAGFANISDCYFNAYVGIGVIIQNTITPDNGDSIITGCTFNNSSAGIAIKQFSSGGLRIENNKFLGGAYHYLSDYNTGASRTGQLTIIGNSFDQASSALIAFNESSSTPFSLISIQSNLFNVSNTKYAIYCGANSGFPYLYGLTIGSNLFYFLGDGTGLYLNGVADGCIYSNHFRADVGHTITAVRFGDSAGVITYNPQSLVNISTETSGETYAVVHRTVPPYRTYAGNPNNNVTPNMIGEVLLDTTNNIWYKSTGTTGTSWGVSSGSYYAAPSTACSGAITTACSWTVAKSGNIVTLSLPGVQGASSASPSINFGAVIPAAFLPLNSYASIMSAPILNGGSNVSSPGNILVDNTGAIKIFLNGSYTGNFSATGNSGLSYPTCVSWVGSAGL